MTVTTDVQHYMTRTYFKIKRKACFLMIEFNPGCYSFFSY